jgi:folate-binding protein YgfZ
MNASLIQNPSATATASAAFEFQSLISGAGIYDIPNRAKLSLTGKDRVRWLNGMITNNIRDLAVGRGVYAFVLAPQGKILGDLFAYNCGESIVLDTDQAQLARVFETLKRYIIMDKVEMADITVSASVIGVAGPRAAEIVGRVASPVTADSSLQVENVTASGIRVTLVRGDNPAIPTFELWLDPAHGAQVKTALLEAGAQEVGAGALELLRIASGTPRYGQDIHDRDLPQETGQARALNFIKGCYIGQEIVERIRARGNVHRMFSGFLVDGDQPAPGTKIQAEGKDAGEVTSVALLPVPSGDVKVALGYIRREAAAKELKAGTAILKVSGLPFAQVFGA